MFFIVLMSGFEVVFCRVDEIISLMSFVNSVKISKAMCCYRRHLHYSGPGGTYNSHDTFYTLFILYQCVTLTCMIHVFLKTVYRVGRQREFFVLFYACALYI